MQLFKKNIPESLRRELFGLHFPHPVGLAPGADPDCRKYNSFPSCAFVEAGPLIPTEAAPIIPETRYGFRIRKQAIEPNGIKQAIANIQAQAPRTLLAANIAPLPSRPDCDAVTRDLLQSFTYLYDFVDLFIIDTFRKNNDSTAPLQSAEYLAESMDALLDMRLCYEVPKPILIRVDSDIQPGSLAGMLDYMMLSGLDGIIAGNQTYPLELIRRIGYFTGGRFPIVACGGIETPEQADELLAAGAVLLQTGRKAARGILNHLIDTTTA